MFIIAEQGCYNGERTDLWISYTQLWREMTFIGHPNLASSQNLKLLNKSLLSDYHTNSVRQPYLRQTG